MFKTYAMSASKTRLVFSIGGGFTVVEKTRDALVLPGDVPLEAPHDPALALALGCVLGEWMLNESPRAGLQLRQVPGAAADLQHPLTRPHVSLVD